MDAAGERMIYVPGGMSKARWYKQFRIYKLFVFFLDFPLNVLDCSWPQLTTSSKKVPVSKRSLAYYLFLTAHLYGECPSLL